MIKKLFLYTIMLLLLSFTVSAYNINDLQHYWTMGDGNGTYAYDTVQGIILKSSAMLTSVTGIRGNALYQPQGISEIALFYNDNGDPLPLDYGSIFWSMNFWLNQVSNQGATYATCSQYRRSFTFDSNYGGSTGNHEGSVRYFFSQNSSDNKNIACCRYISSTWSSCGLIALNASLNNWHMYTLVFNQTSSTMKVYVDGILYTGSFGYNILANSYYIRIPSLNDAKIDEYSLWNSTLNSSDIQTLYNNGTGLTYALTLTGGNSSSGNISEYTNFCLDDERLCYFSYYNDSSLSYECYANQSYTCLENCIFDNPAYCSEILAPGTFTINGSSTVFSKNQCGVISGIDLLCNDSSYDNVSNAFYCSTDNIQFCYAGCRQMVLDNNTNQKYFYDPVKTCEIMEQDTPIFYNMICSPFWMENFKDLGGLNTCDTYSYLSIPMTVCSNENIDYLLNLSLTHTLYVEGQCMNITCQNTCINNTYSCANTLQQQKCMLFPDGCYRNNITLTCNNGDLCSSGSCIAQDIIEGGGIVPDTFNITSIPIDIRYIILVILIFISLIAPMLIAGQDGVLAGLAFSAVLSIAVTIIFRLSLLIPVVYVILAAAIFAVLMRKTVS